jgi:5'-3' exonuclease
MYRVIDGDKSDNVPGIKGFGLKTLIKKVPKILEDKKVTTEDLIAEGFDTDIINRNYDLMQLDDVNISGKAKLEIQHSVDENDTQLIKYEFQKMMIEDKCVATFMNLDSWLAETFNKLNIIARNHYDR